MNNILSLLRVENKHLGGVTIGWIVSICFVLLALSVTGCNKNSNKDSGDNRGVTVDNRADEILLNTQALGNYHALIIGINTYHRWPELKFAYNDANDIRSLLAARYGFAEGNIRFLANDDATRKNIVTVLTQLLSNLTAQDNLLIYYAGHGQLDPLTDSGYWIPVEGDIYDETSWIRFSTIVEKITAQNVKLKNILLITDSCYGGALSRAGPTAGKANPDQDGQAKYLSALSQLASKPSRQVVASGGFEEVPDKSVFAELLKRNLASNTLAMIDVEYLFFKNILPELIKIGTQRPRISKLASGLDLDGQFIFALTDGVMDPGTDVVVTGGDTDGQASDHSVGDLTNSSTQAVEHSALAIAAKPQITLFTATPLEVNEGQMVTVSWQTQGAVAVTLNGSTVALNGATKMLPAKTATYTLNAVNADGDIASSDLLVEVLVPRPEIVVFDVAREVIQKGEVTTLRWQVEGANKVDISGIGAVNNEGQAEISPSADTTYELVATNSVNVTQKKQIHLKVVQPEPEILAFTITPETLVKGASAVLSWNSAHAQIASINGRAVEVKGRMEVNPSATTTFELVVANSDGKKSQKTITLTVTNPLEVRPIGTVIKPLEPIRLTPAIAILASGSVAIKQTYRADLDSVGAPANDDADIWFQAKTATDRYLSPRGGALMALMGSSKPDLAGCKNARLGTSAVNLNRVKEGDFICVKTSQGHFSQIRVTALPGASPGVLKINFITWK